jgi:thioredoxin-like negative regulator of GroEL
MHFLLDEYEFSIKGIQVLYFYASWMPQHKKMLSSLSKMEEKYQYEFIAFDTDYFKSFCKRFNVSSIPTIIILDDGEEKKRIEGIVLISSVKNMFFNFDKEKNNG